jgi:hypothetical protein
MKTFISKLFFISIATLLFASCQKDENKQYFLGGTAPALTASVSGTIPIAYATETQNAVTFNWTNPAYIFTTGISSQDVSYTLEIDKTGNNLAGASKQSISIAKDLTVTYTQKQFNVILASLGLTVGVTTSIDVRIVASINGVQGTKLYSSILTFNVTPYNPPPKVALPSTGQLFLVGSATAGGWNNPVPVPSQQFTQVSTTLYTITVPLTGGQKFLFLPKNGDWGHKYASNQTTNPTGDTGGDFGYDWSDDIPGPAVSGTYKIAVDFQAGKFTVTKQ